MKRHVIADSARSDRKELYQWEEADFIGEKKLKDYLKEREAPGRYMYYIYEDSGKNGKEKILKKQSVIVPPGGGNISGHQTPIPEIVRENNNQTLNEQIELAERLASLRGRGSTDPYVLESIMSIKSKQDAILDLMNQLLSEFSEFKFDIIEEFNQAIMEPVQGLLSGFMGTQEQNTVQGPPSQNRTSQEG